VLDRRSSLVIENSLTAGSTNARAFRSTGPGTQRPSRRTYPPGCCTPFSGDVGSFSAVDTVWKFIPRRCRDADVLGAAVVEAVDLVDGPTAP